MNSTPIVPGMTPRSLSGSQPGLLDPSQPQRLLHFSSSRLSFASFNPRTASSNSDLPDLHKLSLQEQLNLAKRVVLETTPSGESFWRFVPRARRDDGVADEGLWPRLINLCGELIEVSQDQWDIYKLDPFYECRVCAPPQLTTITLAVPTAPPSPLPARKRPMAPPTPPRDQKQSATLSETLFASSDEEDEVEDMIIDDPPLAQRPKSAAPTPRTQRIREEILKTRDARRAKIRNRFEKLNTTRFDIKEHVPAPRPPPPENKRHLNNVNGGFRSPPDLHYTEHIDDEERNAKIWETVGNTKRNRTISPAETRRKLDSKRISRDRRKQQRHEEDMRTRRQARDEAFLREVYENVPQPSGSTPRRAWTEGPEDPQTIFEEYEGEGDDTMDDEQPEQRSADAPNQTAEPRSQTEEPHSHAEAPIEDREASIAESRRKLAELERDRPLWEEAARTRQAREKAEEEASRAIAEERRKARIRREAEERLRQARQEEADAAAREEEARQEREAADRRARSRRHRQERWNAAQWTAAHALARYRELSEMFDNTKFTAEDPLSFDMVPWPILKCPNDIHVEDVEWAAVEQFFSVVQPMMRAPDYKTFVEKSHRRFHPDRWRSRNVLKSVLDEAEKGYMEVAANTVAQALTPLWKDLTGR